MTQKNLILSDEVKSKGDIELLIEYKDGKKEQRFYKNTILRTGRNALASSLTNQIGDSYNFFINSMLFGDGGTNTGVKKYVSESRNGLFGITRINKPVIANINPDIPYQATFVCVVRFEDGNGYTLNEMALQMNSGDLYSMTTFPDFTKTSQMQLTWTWRLTFI